jgi:ubiquinone/menaquinone biosynthesis C-methylase UbiE
MADDQRGPHDYLEFHANFDDPATVSAYDELPLWSSLAGTLLLRHVPLRRDLVVLDVGCGTGFPLIEVAQRLGPASKVYGVDVWDAALERAREKATTRGVENIDIRHADAAALPFADDMFDLIVSNLGLNNFADAPGAVRECRRVLKPDGVVALTTNLQGHMREFYDVFAATLGELGETAALDALAVHIDDRATVDRVRELFVQAGLRLSKLHQESAVLRYSDRSALLRSYFIKLGFLDAWKAVVATERRAPVFARLEANLNAVARDRGELLLTIPLAYVEGRRL